MYSDAYNKAEQYKINQFTDIDLLLILDYYLFYKLAIQVVSVVFINQQTTNTAQVLWCYNVEV